MGTFITGPATGMLLADLGADVLKVEHPEGDPFRQLNGGLYAPHFQTYNRNKRSISLNTKDGADLAMFDGLIGEADVFIQNFRPGVAERIGVGPTRLMSLNSRLVYCGISGFGASGPDKDRPVFDTIAQAASGFLRLLINRAHPRVVGPAIADAVTGSYAALGILAALHQRSETGKGCNVGISMLEAMCHFNLDDFTHFFSAGEVMTAQSRPNVSQSYVFECSDGGWIALHMSSPTKFWENLAMAIERPDMFDDARFSNRSARIGNYDAVVEFLAPLFRRRSRPDWAKRLEQFEVPSSPVYASNEALETPQAKHLQLEIEAPQAGNGRFRTVRSPLTFDGQRALAVTPPPLLGEHNSEVKNAPGGSKWPRRAG
jgi:crotonobetainyl-CoA:carnitine CoA-transferase CaiB-like acyl-CoA transferase